MKKQISSSMRAHLIRSAFYVVLLLAMCVIPFALGQRNATKQTGAKPSAAASASQLPPLTGLAGGAPATGVNTTVILNPPPVQPQDRSAIDGTVTAQPQLPNIPTTPGGCQFRVLIVYADNGLPTQLQSEILAEPGVTVVDLFDGNAGTPTLAQLQQYDIVVPYSNFPFLDAITLGNNLADYVDGGGIVVQYGFAHRGPGQPYGINGRWVSDGYNPYDYGLLLVLNVPFALCSFNAGHPLMGGVTTLNSNFQNKVTLAAGATQVAEANNGNSLVAFRPVSLGHTTVGVTAYVGADSTQSGDWGKVIVNAGRWLLPCGGTPTPTPTATPTATPGPCQFRVLIAHADRGQLPTRIQNAILAEPDVIAVDLFDASSGTPTLPQLQQYNIVFALTSLPWNNAVAMGDVLADYEDAGGVVVVGTFAWDTRMGWNLAGRWMTGGYTPYNFTNQTLFSNNTANITDPGHPLMQGVSCLSAFHRNGLTLAAGASATAVWTDGPPAVAYKTNNGHTAVGLNAYLGFLNQFSGEWGRVIVNAGRWLLPCATPTPTPTPTATATPTPTPTPTPTVTPTPTPTVTPTATPTPTLTPTPTPTPTPGQITLHARGYKVHGLHTVDLFWNGATSANIDVYRNGVVIATVPNIPGFYTDHTGARGKGTYTYRVCEAGTQNCSNQVTVKFGGGP